MTPTNLCNAMNGVTLFGHSATGTIHNSAADESNDPAWVAAVAKAKEQGYSGHAVWAVAQTIFQNEQGAGKVIKNDDTAPALPQEQPDNGGMMNMAILNSGTSEGAHKGWETRKGAGDDAEHGEERHESGHDFNWMKSCGTGEKGEVWGTLLHKGKSIDGSGGWYRTHDPKEAAQRALDLYGKPADRHTVSDDENVVGGHNVTHNEHGLVGFVKARREDVGDGHYAATGEWSAHDIHGNSVDNKFHPSKEDAANAVSVNAEQQFKQGGNPQERIKNSAGKSVLTHGLEPMLNTWSDAAREASAEVRKGRILKDDKEDMKPQPGEENHCNYIAFYKGKQVGVKAPTKYDAQKIAAAHYGSKKGYDVNVELHSKADGVPIEHVASN